VVCLTAGVIILTKWKQKSSASLWALLGFGLGLILCFVIPIGQTILQQWVFLEGQPQSRMWAFTAFSAICSVLHGVVYALLLMAVLAGRSKPDVANPTSLNPQ
jgi:hypothetical protein